MVRNAAPAHEDSAGRGIGLAISKRTKQLDSSVVEAEPKSIALPTGPRFERGGGGGGE